MKMIYLPIEVQLRMIREDLAEIKSVLNPAYPYSYDPIYGRMLHGYMSPPEMGEGSILMGRDLGLKEHYMDDKNELD